MSLAAGPSIGRWWPMVAGATLLAVVLALQVGRLQAAELRFEVPVDCDFERLCSIQKYIDHDPGPALRDHACGTLTSPDHNGIDFRVPTYRDMLGDGVPVVAAAPGVVLRLRDGVEDVSVEDVGHEVVGEQTAGNAVILDHGDGWTTQYSHLRKGSIAVRPGQRVEAGDRLGLIGLSGLTEFPHVHFTVRRNQRVIDPFTGLPQGSPCGKADQPLWSDSALAVLTYRPGGLIDAGFAAERPDIPGVLKGRYLDAVLPADAPLLLFWAVTWGVREGDREEMRLYGPDGALLAEIDHAVEKDLAQRIRYIGKRLRANRWAPGTYRGEYRLTRKEDGGVRVIVDSARDVLVR